jgi:hypothetical protein
MPCLGTKPVGLHNMVQQWWGRISGAPGWVGWSRAGISIMPSWGLMGEEAGSNAWLGLTSTGSHLGSPSVGSGGWIAKNAKCKRMRGVQMHVERKPLPAPFVLSLRQALFFYLVHALDVAQVNNVECVIKGLLPNVLAGLRADADSSAWKGHDSMRLGRCCYHALLSKLLLHSS